MEIVKKLDDRINGGTLEEGSNISLDTVRGEAFREQSVAGKQILEEIKLIKPKRSGLFLQNSEEEQYKEHKSNFFTSLLTATFYGISPVLWKEGACCCWLIKDRPIGFLEDLNYKFLNTNTIASMLTACHGHPFGREDKRIAFIMHSALGLSFALLLSSIDSTTIKIVLNILVVAPATLFINEFVYLNLSCPCLAPYKYGHYMSCLVGWIESVGRITVAPLFIASIALLVLCALFAITHDGGNFLSYYIVQTQVVSFGGELIILYLQFLDGKSYYSFNLFCFPVFSVGIWFNEYLKAYRYDVVNEGFYEEKEYGYAGYISITKRFSTEKTFANVFAIDQLYLDRNKVFPLNEPKELVMSIVTDPTQLSQPIVVAPHPTAVAVTAPIVSLAAVTAPTTSLAAVTAPTTSLPAVTAPTTSLAAVTAPTTSIAAVTAPTTSITAAQQSPGAVPSAISAATQYSSIGDHAPSLFVPSDNVATEPLQLEHLAQDVPEGWN
jgi:hypothetical protein